MGPFFIVCGTWTSFLDPFSCGTSVTFQNVATVSTWRNCTFDENCVALCTSWRRYATACRSNFGHWTSLDMWFKSRVHKVPRNSGCSRRRCAKCTHKTNDGRRTIISTRLNVYERRWMIEKRVGEMFMKNAPNKNLVIDFPRTILCLSKR